MGRRSLRVRPAVFSVVVAALSCGDPFVPPVDSVEAQCEDAAALPPLVGGQTSSTGFPIKDLGTSADAVAINESGYVVGSWIEGFGFRWTEAGEMEFLSDVSVGTPEDINDRCQVVGARVSSAFLWSETEGLTMLGTLGGEGGGHAVAINNSGAVVGRSVTPGGVPHAFLWTEEGGMVDLGTLGGLESGAEDINDQGQVVGWSDPAEGQSHAFLWTEADGMVDLGTLGGQWSAAQGINTLGQVVGQSLASDGSVRAFLWTEATGMVNLGSLGGFSSVAWAVNDLGQVVGSGTLPGGSESHAFLWTEEGGMVDLGTLGGPTSSGRDINNRGHVVGRSEASDRSMHAVLWDPL